MGVLLETENGNMIVAEQHRSGKLAWEENPADLDDRVSVAKVVRMAECKRGRVTVAQMKAVPAESHCKCYAQSVFNKARGDSVSLTRSGFLKRHTKSTWNLNAKPVSSGRSRVAAART